MNLKQFKNKKFSIFFGLLATASLFSYLNAQTCQRGQVTQVVGGTSFANSSTTANQWDVSDIEYYGSATQEFSLNGTSFHYTSTDNVQSNTDGGNYTVARDITQLHGSFNDGTTVSLWDGGTGSMTQKDGTFLIRPNNKDWFAEYKIEGLIPGETYIVDIGIRKAMDYPGNDNPCWRNYIKPGIQICRLDNNSTSTSWDGQGVSDVTKANNSCDGPNAGQGWDSNNASGNDWGFVRGATSWAIHRNVNLNQGFPAGTTGFKIRFKIPDYDNMDFVFGIDYIKITGPIMKTVVNSQGSTDLEVCEGNSVTLKAQGIGTSIDQYEWRVGGTNTTNFSGTTLPSQRITSGKVYPTTTAQRYFVKNTTTGECTYADAQAVDCCGATAKNLRYLKFVRM